MSKKVPLGVGLLLVFGAIWMLTTSVKPVRAFIDRLDNLGYDIQLRSRVFTLKNQTSNSVVIVDIDDKSLKAEGRWPWSRSKIAQLVDMVKAEGAAVIAFDIFFPEDELNVDEELEKVLKKHNIPDNYLVELKKYAPLFDEDNIFAKSIANAPAVLSYSFVLKKVTHNELPAPTLELTAQEQKQLLIMNPPGYIANISLIQNAVKKLGFINVFPDDDGIVRRVPLVMQQNGKIYVSLALQAYLLFLDEKMELYTADYHNTLELEGVKIGDYIIPTDARGIAYIPFVGKSYTFPYYSATDVFNHTLPPDALLGKIVFIGTSATGLGDLHPTAIQNPFPGVEIQASLVDGMLRHEFSYKPAWAFGANIFTTLLFGLLAAFLFPRLGPKILAVIFVIFPVLVVYANNLVWAETGLIFSVLVPIILVLAIAIWNILYGYLFETRRREQIKEMFGQYVPEQHIDEMLKAKGTFGLRGEDREMTVLFSDIRNFTAASETLTATELVDMLNLYFTPMTEIIYKYVGTIDKYVGDMIIAFWGAPLADEDHAYHAICAALEMQAKVRELQHTQAMKKWADISMGIGINTGHMNVGDMGSRYRRNYTVMGDSVNLASRVEGLTRYYNVDIIVTENTQQSQPKFVYRKLDKVRVKGKKDAVAIFEVIGLDEQVDAAVKKELEVYHQALNDYFQKNWDQALALFNQIHNAHPDTKIYSIYVKRLQEYKISPPPQDWDGTFVHKEK